MGDLKPPEPLTAAHDTAGFDCGKAAPDPIPAILLGRLAVDRGHARQGIGSGLLKDAFLRARQVSRVAVARLLLPDALDEEARSFYLRHGFKPSPLNPLQLMHSLVLRVAGSE